MSQASIEHTQAEQVTCTKCGAPCSAHPGYTTWCDHCGWNLQPRTRQPSRDSFEELDAELERQHSRSAFDTAKAADTALPHVPSNAQLLAALVHLSTLVIAASGLWLIVRLFTMPNINNFWNWHLTHFWIGLAVRCRVGSTVSDPQTGSRSRPKRAHRLVSACRCNRSCAQHVRRRRHQRERIVYAASSRAGLLQKPFVALGLPLILGLNPQELVADIAFALARDSNTDPRNNLFIGGAIRTLLKWYDILQGGVALALSASPSVQA